MRGDPRVSALPNVRERCAIYCRVSTPGQADRATLARLRGGGGELLASEESAPVDEPEAGDKTSLASQEELCRGYCDTHRYEVVGLFVDVYSGDYWRERKELSRLRELVRSEQVDVILAINLDRYSRNQTGTAILIDEIEHHNARIEFVQEEFDDTPVGKMVRNVKAFAAELELEKIKERTQRGRRARAEGGRPLLGNRPLFGYRLNADHSAYEIDESEAPTVRRVFKRIGEGMTLRDIARELSADGVLTPSGLSQWRQTNVAKLLHHPSYAGLGYSYRYRSPSKQEQRDRVRRGEKPLPKQVIRPESEWIPLPDGTIPAIVDRDVFDRAQAVLVENRREASRRISRPENYLLRGGFAHCGYCGAAMHAGTTAAGLALYYCGARKYREGTCERSGTIRAAEIDPVIWGVAQRILSDPAIIERQMAKLRKNDPTPIDLAAVDRSLLDVTRKINALFDLIESGNVDRDDVGARLKMRTADKKRLQEERERIIERQAAWHSVKAQLDQLEHWRATIASHMETATISQRRSALKALGIAVQIYQLKHEPRYAITADIGGAVPVINLIGTAQRLFFTWSSVEARLLVTA